MKARNVLWHRSILCLALVLLCILPVCCTKKTKDRQLRCLVWFKETINSEPNFIGEYRPGAEKLEIKIPACWVWGIEPVPTTGSAETMDLGYRQEDWKLLASEINQNKIPGLRVSSSARLTDSNLEHIASLTGLKMLNLSKTRTKGTNLKLKYLMNMTGLQWLDLSSTWLADADLVHLKYLTELKVLDLSRTTITDAGLEHLGGLSGLQQLALFGTQITDASLPRIASLSELKELNLSLTRITSYGLKHLTTLEKLQVLNLARNPIRDVSVNYLKDLTGLKVLDVSHSKLTRTGFKELQQSLPNVHILNEKWGALEHD